MLLLFLLKFFLELLVFAVRITQLLLQLLNLSAQVSFGVSYGHTPTNLLAKEEDHVRGPYQN